MNTEEQLRENARKELGDEGLKQLEEKKKLTLIDYLPEFIEEFEKQLASDQARWGDTWKKRPIGDMNGQGDQVDRSMQRFRDYYDMYKGSKGAVNMPWLKVVGEAFICWVRERHPDTYTKE